MNNITRTSFTRLEKLNESKLVFVLILVSLFIGMLMLNGMTLYRSDDFTFLTQIRNENGSIFNIALACTQSFYNRISGRFNMFWIFVFLQLDKYVFDIVNSFFFLSLIYLLYVFILGNFKVNNFTLIYVTGMAWLFISDFGNVVLWLSASPLYVWTVVFCLLLLLPLRIYYHLNADKKQNFLWFIPIIPLSVLFIGGMETIGGTMLLINMLFIISFFLEKRRIPVWSIINAIITLVILCLSVFSPGTIYRVTALPKRNILITIAERIYLQLYNVEQYFTWVIIVLLFVLVLYVKYGTLASYKLKLSGNIINTIIHIDKNTRLILIFLLAALISEISLFLSPYIMGRQNIFTICCIIIAMGIAGVNLDESVQFIRYCKRSFISVLAVLCVIGYTVTFTQTYNAYTMQKVNVNNIELSKSQGVIDDIEIRYTRFNNSHMAYSYKDLMVYEKIVESYCEYYGINSIKLIPNDTY